MCSSHLQRGCLVRQVHHEAKPVIHPCGWGQRFCSPCAAVAVHGQSQPGSPWDGIPASIRSEIPPHTLPASLLAPIIHLAASLWKSALKFSCSPCFWAVAAPQALAQGTRQWGPTPNCPKQPQNCSHCSPTHQTCRRKNGKIKYTSMRVISFQGQKVAHEFAGSAWRSSCDINQKFKTLNFWVAPTPQPRAAAPRVLSPLEKQHLTHS